MQEIRPADVPQEIMETACRLLNRCIQEALADPEKQADFEAWKKGRKTMDDLEETCELCGRFPTFANPLECHHVYFGVGYRKLSEQYGMKAYICHECHQGAKGVHNNREKDLLLKRRYQKQFEREIGTREEFMEIFGRNYL